ncbi:1234_t:CDS:2, partial [Dentiscutata erythropus]
FGVYVENCAKKLKWYEVLNSTLYEPLELLQFINVNQTVQTISKAFSKVALSSNDLLLSGILDIESLNTLNSPIKEALRTKKLWSAVKEDLKIKPLLEGLKEFIINYVNTDNAPISAPFDNNLLYKTRSLIDAVRQTFVLDGPIKKPDIYGVVESETHSDLKLLLETFLEFFIIDKKIAPFSRLRKLETLEIPFNDGSTQELIRLIQVLYTFSIYIDKNLEIIKLIEEESPEIDCNAAVISIDTGKMNIFIRGYQSPLILGGHEKMSLPKSLEDQEERWTPSPHLRSFNKINLMFLLRTSAIVLTSSKLKQFE